MKRRIELDTWKRKEHFEFFSQFDEPYYGVAIKVDCTTLYHTAKAAGHSFYLAYLHRFLAAINAAEALRTRIIDGQPYIFERIDVSATVDRPDGTFGFSYIQYEKDFNTFAEGARKEIERVRNSSLLFPERNSDHVIHFSALPWIDFTAVSHARHYAHKDSTPKISMGKMTEAEGRKTMPLSVHVHHALVDGVHLAALLDDYQKRLNE
ncbi:MAG: chloramphenicol acetyltransferase [Cyclobacteriaceae bacterium]